MSLGPQAQAKLEQKTVLITGASAGVGEAIAREFVLAAGGNIRLVLAARRADRLAELSLQLKQGGAQVHTQDFSDEDVEEMFATNVIGLIKMTQTVIRGMRERNSGDIVQVGSIAGIESYPGGSIYCATKSAVRSFTQAVRKELISTKIRVLWRRSSRWCGLAAMPQRPARCRKATSH
ncbi:hypothetical protein KL938_004024 [Ogataea parapolymorpha]|nr:hypothetical protein KL938_004024 [Ogataea parapolymorpha]